MVSSSAPDPSAPHSSRWPRVVTFLGLGLCALTAFVFYQTRRLPKELFEKARSVLSDTRSVAAAFRAGTVTTRFISTATEMSGTSYFQFATLEQTEIFERTDSRTILWGELALPDVVVRAEAPVSTTYYLDLDDRWELEIDGRVIVVRAPRIRYNTPAIDVSSVRYDVTDGSILRDEDAALDELREGLSKLANERARKNVALVRELGRKNTRALVRHWLLTSYDDADSYRIEVLFADELDAVTRRDLPDPR